ncbi:MAG: MFS transporter [Candidatus Limnocylindrales bacterium]
MTAADLGATIGVGGRPSRSLPLWMLVQLSLYWLGLSLIFSALDTVILPERFSGMMASDSVNLAVGVLSFCGALVAIIVQPTIGSISDYTISRWGRRKPYIVIGSTLDILFLAGLATSNAFLAITAFYMLLQFSSNFAQGPFQGYVPDLVPAQQVGLASALVGIMSVVGPVTGVIIASIPLTLAAQGETPDFTLVTIALGGIELATALATVISVDEGRRAKDRLGRSWRQIAFETWGRDVLHQRSFVYLVASRLFILAGVSMFVREADLYLNYVMGFDTDERGFWVKAAALVLGVSVALVCLPAARLSDRVGRKPLIYAACAFGATGSAIVLVAPSVQVAIVGGVVIGIASGTFVAVDWALMSDIIPKADAGRYMGLSNVATGLAGTLAVASGGALVFLITHLLSTDLVGPATRLVFVLAIVFFGLGALLVRQVDPRRRED